MMYFKIKKSHVITIAKSIGRGIINLIFLTNMVKKTQVTFLEVIS